MSLWRRYLMGMLSGSGSVVLKAGLNILVIPALIAKLGMDVFSLYILLVSTLELSMMLDCGISIAVVKLLGGSEPDSPERRTQLKVAHTLFACLSGGFLAVGLLVWPWFSTLFHIDPILVPMAQFGFFLIVLEAAIWLYGYYYEAVLLAHCSHQWANLADLLYYLVSNAGALLLLIMGYHLPAVMALRLLGALLRLGVMAYHSLKLEAYVFKPKMPFKITTFKEICRLSLHAMTINLSVIISHKVDVFVIAFFLPLHAVGIYDVVFRLLGVILQISTKLAQGVFPLFSKMEALSQKTEAKQFFLRMSSFLYVLSCLMVLLIVSYYSELFGLFSAGRIPIAETIPLLWIAVFCTLSGVLQMPAGAWLFAWGRQKYMSVSSATTALINLFLSILLVQWLGVCGVALGTLIPQLLQHQFSLIRTTCKGLSITFGQYMREVHIAMILPFMASFIWVRFCQFLLSQTNLLSHLKGMYQLFPMGLVAGSALLLGLGLWFALTATDVEKNILRNFLDPLQFKLRQAMSRSAEKTPS